MSARRRPLMKGDSTESSNPFFDDEEDASSEENDRRPQEDHEGKSASHVAQASLAKDEDIILPEWLVELPEELEVGLFFFYIRKCVLTLYSRFTLPNVSLCKLLTWSSELRRFARPTRTKRPAKPRPPIWRSEPNI